MSDERPPGVLGALPHTRPHRRSDKRPAQPRVAEAVEAKPRTAKPRAAEPRPAKPRAAKPRPAKPRATAPRPAMPPPPAATAGPLGTAVQAAAELAEIGLTASARALRGALSRLPRP
ncbi:MAG TPA: hypothetical protein VGL51_02915 [Solirubrobacteraceae bacterium]